MAFCVYYAISIVRKDLQMRQAENEKGVLYGNTEMGDHDTGKRQNVSGIQQASAKKHEITASDLSVQEIAYICGQITPKGRLRDAVDKTERSQAELEKIHKLLKYADEDMMEERSEEFPHISIGQVWTDSNGKRWCRRYADIENRKMRRFIRNEEEPPYFGNREKLPVFDGPDTDGFLGIWNWKAVENYNDSNRDYVKTQYNSSIKYIEVVELAECHSCSDISEYLAGNTFSGIAGSKILFGYRVTEREMSGLLCGTRELEVCNGCVRLKKEVCVLP